MRRIPLIVNIHRITVARKLAFLAEVAKEKRQQYFRSRPKIKDVQFDDLITMEHTKYKPLAVSMAVENFAMLRANINRLFRKTWCTTKKRERLAQHLMVYSLFHNSLLTKCPVQFS